MDRLNQENIFVVSANLLESLQATPRESSLTDRFEEELQALRKREAERLERDATPSGDPTLLAMLHTRQPSLTAQAQGQGERLATEEVRRRNGSAIVTEGTGRQPRDAANVEPVTRKARASEAGAARQLTGADDARIVRASLSDTDAATVADVKTHLTQKGDGESTGVPASGHAASGKDGNTANSMHPVAEAARHVVLGGTPDGLSLTPATPGISGTPRTSGLTTPDTVTMTTPQVSPTLPDGDSRERSQHGKQEAGGSMTGAIPVANGHAPLRHLVQTSEAQSPRQRAPQSQAQPQQASAAPEVASTDAMRYAFGSWGRGHFVQVQVVHVDGRKGFVLGASDAMVKRRLSASLSGAAQGIGAREHPGSREDVGVHAIQSLPASGDGADEESGC